MTSKTNKKLSNEKYRLANKEKLNAKARAYYKENKDHCSKVAKAWRKKNKKKVAGYHKKWHDNHPEYNKAYNKKNKKRLNANQRARRAKNKAKYLAIERAYIKKNIKKIRLLGRVIYAPKTSTRKIKNVYYDINVAQKGNKPWRVQVGKDYKDVFCGYYYTEEDAAEAAIIFRAKLKVKQPGMPPKYHFSQEEIDQIISEYKGKKQIS